MVVVDPVIEVEHLTKRYRVVTAVDDVSFVVGRGEVFGIVGPNGAGKTTTVECLTGLRRPDGGTVQVLGLDPARAGRALRQRMGVQLQQAALPDRLTVCEALRLYASFYRRPVPWAPLLDRWGLAEKVDTAFADLSGGQRQRLFVTLALINDPELVVLDELSAGLDPQARRASWELVRQIRDQGTTVVLVTHFMEEAEHPCDRVMVIDQGRVVALDSPASLNRGLQRETRVRFGAPPAFDPDWLASLPGVAAIELDGSDLVVSGGGFLMAEVATALARRGLAPPDLRTEQATLEDVFLGLTGAAVRP
ncbi:MAG: ABC transporter ATP-binding protein [Chloroflexia bacterium]|nr:ABC transporter ATP-binding protein [Chloroflexia bacterium]